MVALCVKNKRGNLVFSNCNWVSDLIYELEKYDARDMVNKTALGNIFKVFKNYSLMDVDGNVGDIDCKLILYPSCNLL